MRLYLPNIPGRILLNLMAGYYKVNFNPNGQKENLFHRGKAIYAYPTPDLEESLNAARINHKQSSKRRTLQKEESDNDSIFEPSWVKKKPKLNLIRMIKYETSRSKNTKTAPTSSFATSQDRHIPSTVPRPSSSKDSLTFY